MDSPGFGDMSEHTGAVFLAPELARVEPAEVSPMLPMGLSPQTYPLCSQYSATEMLSAGGQGPAIVSDSQKDGGQCLFQMRGDATNIFRNIHTPTESQIL